MNALTPLKDLATIRPGYHVRGRIEDNLGDKLAIIQMSDVLPDGSIDYHNLTRLDSNSVKPDHMLHPGDVLLTSRGQTNEGVLVAEIAGDTVASSHFYRIRLNGPDLNPEYLTWYLNQPAAQRELKRFKKSSSIPLLSREGVESLPVPIPPIAVQVKIAKLGWLAQKEQELASKLAQERGKLIAGQLLELISTYENGASNVTK